MPKGNTNIKDFTAILTERDKANDIGKITLSKVRDKNSTLKNILIRPVLIKGEKLYSCTYRYEKRDEVKNYSFDVLISNIENWLTTDFLNASLLSSSLQADWMQSVKGTKTLLIRNLEKPISLTLDHNRQKHRMISSENPFLHALGITDAHGKVHDKAQDKYRQINKYTEIISHLIEDHPKDQIFRISDMGSGKGYLSFALYTWLTNQGYVVQMTGYDIREDMVNMCNQTAQKLGLEGLNFIRKDINEVTAENCDMVIALHACDIATDMAIAKGIETSAKYIVVAPCCHKQIRKSMEGENLLTPIIKHGILKERQAELITDGIRALLMESVGYKTKVFEFISTEHTPKNLMITGIKGNPDPTARQKVDAIKIFFGIPFHYLEQLIDGKT